MAEIRFGRTVFDCEPSETVLDALRRQGLDLAYSCAKGVCQTCMLRAAQGTVPPESQATLKDTLRAQGYFLPCICVPQNDLVVDPPLDDGAFEPTTVTELEPMAPDVRRLRLRPARPFSYRAGQFIHLRRWDGLLRSYSLASVPGLDRDLEVHVKRMPEGRMSTWIFEQLRTGDEIDVRGPNGSCFYLPGDPEQPILLIGTGTGLAPLMGIARDALDQGHVAPIHLYHGTRHPEGLYEKLELEWRAAQHEKFNYLPCLSGPVGAEGCRAGRAEDVALADHGDLTGWRVFLCGCAPMVNAVRKRAYLAGAALADIHADPFELSEV